MHSSTLVMLVAAVFSSASFAQPSGSSSDAGKSGQPSGIDSPTKKTSTSVVDCPKEMANAKEARQAGHVTDKEVVEQRKMAEIKLKRDSADPRRAEKNVGC